MRRLIRTTVTLATVLAVLALAGTAYAASPHFVKASASGPNSAGQLLVSFKEAGLGDNQLITYHATADATATYACINGGGNHPQATNKDEVSGPVEATGTFNSGKNGSISRTLTLNPPSPGSFTCPPGQRRVLADVSYEKRCDHRHDERRDREHPRYVLARVLRALTPPAATKARSPVPAAGLLESDPLAGYAGVLVAAPDIAPPPYFLKRIDPAGAERAVREIARASILAARPARASQRRP